MKKRKKFPLAYFSMMLILLISILTSITSFAWGDNTMNPDGTGGRPSYSLQYINEHAADFGSTPFFNSITIADTDAAWYKDNFGKDLPTGIVTHEKNFVGARENTGVDAGPENVWNGNDITVEDGKEYIIRLFVHNNNPNGENAIAENVKVAFDVPIDSQDVNGQQQVQVNGYITSSNATPYKYWDYVNFNTTNGQKFHLDYVYGSGLLENRGIGSKTKYGAALPLSDDVVKAASGGTLIGYYDNGDRTPDGRIPGCYEYDSYVTIKVKAVFDYDFMTEKKVRIVGDTDKTWKKTVNAKVGDKVEFLIQYKNTSDLRQAGVTIKDTMPSNLRFIEDSIKIKNSSHPKGDKIVDDYLVTTGLRIGNYDPGENAYLTFTAEVVDEDLAEGSNTLVNWVQVGVVGTTITDYARVILYKEPLWFKIISITLFIPIIICLIAIAILQYMGHKKRHS